MSTHNPDESVGEGSAFIGAAMTEGETTGQAASPTASAASSHAATGRGRRPPGWLIAAAPALVVGLVVGLLFGGREGPHAGCPRVGRTGRSIRHTASCHGVGAHCPRSGDHSGDRR